MRLFEMTLSITRRYLPGGSFGVLSLLVCAALLPAKATAQQAAMRIDLVSPGPDGSEILEELTRVTIRVSRKTERVPIELQVVLLLAIEPCASDPAACDGTENFFDEVNGVYGCNDDEDNDGDGVLDSFDPDCVSVPGWSLSVATDRSFNISHATTLGTAADLATRPPGLRDIEGGNFEYTELADPARNAGGREGAVSGVVLSFKNPVMLPHVSESVILIIEGEIDSSALGRGERVEPCGIRIIPSHETGLAAESSGPIRTIVSLTGELPLTPDLQDLIILVEADEDSPHFLRGDCTAGDRINLSDALCVLGWLFLGAEKPLCLASLDANGQGSVDITDAVYILNFLFTGGLPPTPPFPDCGPSPEREQCAESTCPGN